MSDVSEAKEFTGSISPKGPGQRVCHTHTLNGQGDIGVFDGSVRPNAHYHGSEGRSAALPADADIDDHFHLKTGRAIWTDSVRPCQDPIE